ncbi:sodium:solute symporter family protein [Rhodopirellula sp. MGV]|uniref:sodium:solute symporter family protein n=1 Tax=Rhodopirellula sp. MGV TaxID=2023130 RepID=UPI000B96E6FC|nr:sodium:solute symporter family protein [Rhodopirellula sp. MGV]OYP36125.1 sodium:proline symporter [Rhodopirellula sp. MGV]PNY36514.1 sodium:solute symporter family protein [Rhodopirellula baltica]PNY38243.1 sodium:solute symporter family protein [Rhodopirellula baltica]
MFESLDHPGLPQLIIIIIYLGLLLLLGLSSSRLFKGTKEDYQVASHSIGPFLLLMSLFGTTMTAFALVGSSGEAFKEGIGVYGMLASSSGIIHSLCFFIIGVKVWKFARRHKYTTQIEFFRDRLDNDFIGLLLFPILVGLVVPYLLIGVISSGTVVQSLTAGLAPDLFPVLNPAGEPIMAMHGGIPTWLGSLVICVVVLVYVFFGGMRGTAWANTLQTIVFMILGVVTFYVIANRLGGQDSLMENLKVLAGSVPTEKLTRIEMSKTKFFTYLLIPLSVGMFPHLFQHWMTAKSASTFKVPVVCHPLFIMIVWVPCVLVGIWATGDLIPAKPPLPNSPNAILPFLVKTQTGKVLGGLLAAGILAAIMSSLDSQFLCIGTIFTNDVLTHYKGKENVSDTQQVLYTRLFIIAIVAITYALGLLDPKSVFAMGVWCFSGFSALFPIVFAALYWRGLTAAGAICGILAAIASWGYMFYQALQQGLREYVLILPLGGEEYEVMPVVVMLASCLIVMVGVSLVTPKPSDATIKKFFS